MKNKKKDDFTHLCFKYSCSCKRCPRYNKCREEENKEVKVDGYNRFNNNYDNNGNIRNSNISRSTTQR